MSVKKTSFIELHCEKLLLCSMVLLLLGIGVWQFAFLHTEVKVGNKSQDIVQLHKALVEKTKAIQKKMDSDQNLWSFDIPNAKVVSDILEFEKSKDQDISSTKPFDRNQPYFGEMLRGSDLKPEQQYYEPAFQAGKMQGNKLTTDAFDAKAINPEDRAVIAKESPEFTAQFLSADFTDVTWVSPWGVIDLKELQAELARDDPTHNPPIYQVPPPWSNNSFYIIDVTFERQEKGPKEWGTETIVATVPGKVVLTNQKELNRETVFANLDIYENQLQVLQPVLLPLRNSNFQQPSFSTETTEDPLLSIEATRQQALKRLNQKRADLAKIKDDLTSAGGPLSPPPPSGTSGDGDSGGQQGKGKGGGFGMGGGGSMKKGDSGTGVDGQTQAARDKRISLTKKYLQSEKAFQKAEAEFVAKFPDPAKSPADSKKVVQPEKKFKDLSEVLVWTHDFDVREGATYRYRMTSKIYNPFFVRESQLLEAQAHLSKRITLDSVTSAWGAEVTIPLTTSFFLTRGSSRDGIGGRRITVDYFRYFNGELRSTSEDLSVGDHVGRVVESRDGSVDFSTPWYLVDIFDDAGSDQNAGIFALLEQRTSSGEVLQEIRSLADKDSEIYKDFKKQLPAAAPKKIAVQSPKA